jgi:hypothetical protein
MSRHGRGGRRARARRRQRLRPECRAISSCAARSWYGRVVGVLTLGLHNRDELYSVWTVHPHRPGSWGKQHHTLELSEWECTYSQSWGLIFSPSGGGDYWTPRIGDTDRFEIRIPPGSGADQLWVDSRRLVPVVPVGQSNPKPWWELNHSDRSSAAWRPASRHELGRLTGVHWVSKPPGDVLANARHSEGTPVGCEVCNDVYPDDESSTCRHVFWAREIGWAGPGLDDSLPELQAALEAYINPELDPLLAKLEPLLGARRLNGDDFDLWLAKRHLEEELRCDDRDAAATARSALLAIGLDTPDYDLAVVRWLRHREKRKAGVVWVQSERGQE